MFTDKQIAKRGRIRLAVKFKSNRWLLRIRSAPPTRTPYYGKSRVCQITPLLLFDWFQQHKNISMPTVAQMPERGGPKGRLPRAMSGVEIFVKPLFALRQESLTWVSFCVRNWELEKIFERDDLDESVCHIFNFWLFAWMKANWTKKIGIQPWSVFWIETESIWLGK